MAEAREWQVYEEMHPPCSGVIVDGLLGIGATGLPQGVVAAAIRWINSARRRCTLVALDLPSGMNADTGESSAATVRADITVTLAAPKAGFAAPCAWEFLGHLEVADIGLPQELCAAATSLQYIGAPVVSGLLPPRGRETHKGSYGHVLVIGGSHGLSGAPALATMGALRSGAGLVSAAVPENCLAALAVLAPSAMAHCIATGPGGMTVAALAAGMRSVATFDVVLAGPGLSSGAPTAAIIADLLSGPSCRLVLDADALNVLAGCPEQLRRAVPGPSVVITPHPGEAARLLGVTVAEVQANRVQAAQQLAARSGAVGVLKGAGTLVATPAGEVHLNLTGNPGLATGGTGDVLAGVIAGLWAQGLAPLDAARLGVYLHGTAGDLAAWQVGEAALVAEDVGQHLGAAAQWLAALM